RGYGHEDFSSSLSGLNVPEERSRYFGHRIGSQQGAVVTVSATGREAEAEEILTANGGDIGADTTGYDYSTPVANAEQQRIQLLGEVLRVQKERISRGEVRIRKEIVTEQQTIQVPVTREELVIERIPVSGTAAVAGEIGQDAEIRIPLTEERATLDKHTVVREEVAVGKRAVENVQEVGGAVRHEELNVEDTTTGTTTGTTTDKSRF
ncbi:MAG TPA: YsnF/AvaK domain-containing protein, partial [Acidobacteriaceae bacterium]